MWTVGLYEDSNPRKNKYKPENIPELEKTDEKNKSDVLLDDIKGIKEEINTVLEYLNGSSYATEYMVKVSPSKPGFFRAVVWERETRKALCDFLIEKCNNMERIYTPRLDISAFTVNSYANRTK